jgi:hypothetical protein
MVVDGKGRGVQHAESQPAMAVNSDSAFRYCDPATPVSVSVKTLVA